MSKATKRKHVTKEAVDDYFVPEGDEEIVKIFASRGNNLHEVENASGHRYLVSMPTKFRKNIWVKRGDFVVTVPIKEGNKVQGEIVYILLAKQIKYLKDEKLWPVEFAPQVQGPGIPDIKSEKSKTEPTVNGNQDSENIEPQAVDEDSESDSESSDDDLFENPNHRPVHYVDDSSSEEEESSGEESEEGEECVDDADGGNNEEKGATWNNSTEYVLNEGIAKVKLK